MADVVADGQWRERARSTIALSRRPAQAISARFRLAPDEPQPRTICPWFFPWQRIRRAARIQLYFLRRFIQHRREYGDVGLALAERPKMRGEK
jgi:hypothetical protein